MYEYLEFNIEDAKFEWDEEKAKRIQYE